MNCDIFFITYDEPLRENSWADIKRLIPKAKRIHGIKGFDAAYKACANASETERFFTIDGDNELSPSFFEIKLNEGEIPENAVLSWSAKNIVNGLCYGNGGIKNWPKHVTQKMQTHERSDTEEGSVDFCFQLNYLQMPETVSIVRVNGSPYQAFRAGFREGVKMLLDRGKPVRFEAGEAKSKTISKYIWHENLSRLKIWCSVGRDIENGLWSIYGASLGAKMLCMSDWSHESICDYQWFHSLWEKEINQGGEMLVNDILSLHSELNAELDLGLTLLDSEASRFFKSVYVNPPRSGFMFK